MSWLDIKCPKCSARIKRKDVKDSFRCSACGTELSANRSKLTMLVIFLAALPLALFAAEKIAGAVLGGDASYADKKFIAVLLYAGLILLIYPWLLSAKESQRNS